MVKKLLLYILTMSVMAGLLCGCEGWNANKAEKHITDANQYDNVYEITELLDEGQYGEYMNDAGSRFHRLLDFRRRLAESSEFAFYAFASNFVEIVSDEIPETCLVNHGTEFEDGSGYVIDGENITAAEAIQISENFFSLFPLKITEGRCFEASDFDYRNTESIPVILGKAYQDTFQLGDVFEGYYICERRSFKVIGFTDAGSEFYSRSNSRMVSYENDIIMPFQNITEDAFSARAILLQQICGFIVPRNDRDTVLQTIREYLTDTGLADWGEAIIVNEKSLQEKMC